MTIDAPMKTASADQPAEQDLVFGRWATICLAEVTTTFEVAREGVPYFVEEELEPLGKNLLRATNITLTVRDLFRITHHVGEIFFGDERPPPLVLATEEHIAKTFSRWCLGESALDLYLRQTFNFLHDALARRVGSEEANALIEDAGTRFAPIRREVMAQLVAGPRVVRVLSGPTAHMSVPALWAVASVGVGARRTEGALHREALVRRVSSAVGAEVEPKGALPFPLKAALVGVATTLGAAVTATAGYRMLDVSSLYLEHLDGLEALLLDGDPPTGDPDDPGRPGLLEIIDDLDRASSGR